MNEQACRVEAEIWFLVHLALGTTSMVTKREDRHGNSVLEEGRGTLGNLCNGRA